MTSESEAAPVVRPSWWPLVLIIAINLLPVWFLAYGGWSPGDVLVAYWLENVVVGGFTVLKIMTARLPTRPGHGVVTTTRSMRGGQTTTRRSSSLGRGALSAFFVLHFGIFTLVHGIFTALLAFSIGISGSPHEWLIMVLGLVASHGISYVVHWRRGGERDRTSPDMAMTAPYSRIVVLHVVVIASFFLIFRGLGDFDTAASPSGQDLLPAFLLIALKTIVDVGAHLRAHRRTVSA